MKCFKRTLAWLLTVCMVISIFTINGIVAKAGYAWLEFRNGVRDGNTIKYTIDEREWAVTISGLDSFDWKTEGSNPELENIPEGTSLTFTLSDEAISDSSIPKPKMQFGGESMNFSEENIISKTFDASSGPIVVELTSGGGSSGQGGEQGGGTPPTTPTMKTIEFRDAIISYDGKATYTVGETAVEVTVAVDGEVKNISSGEHKEIQVEDSKLSTVTFSFINFDTESMQAVIRGNDGFQQVLAVSNNSASLAGVNFQGMVNFSVESKSSGGGQGGGSEEDPPTGQQEDVNLKVSWSGSFGEIKVGGQSVDLSKSSETFTRLNVNEGKIDISLQAEPTIEFTSIKIDGAEKLSGGQTEDYYTFQIPKEATSVSIAVVTAQSNTYTIQWAYDDRFGDDAKVENGTVEMVSGYKTGANTYWQAESGSIVRVKLVPDYGYQVIGAKINGVVDLSAEDESNEFTFEMPSTHVHFKGIFTKTSDIVSNSSSAVSGASFDGSNVAASGGTARMTIANAAPTSTASVSGVDTSKSVQAVDIIMDQLFYKNTASDVWSTNKTELSSAAEVSLTVNQAADGYTVLRTHNGVVEEISASYDPATNKITFASNKYSTYTLVPLKKSNNTYVPETKSESKGEEAKKPVVVEEVIKDVKQVTADKTALALQTEQLIPTTTFNFSSIKTFKGFVTSVEKASQKTLQADPKAKVVSIYTNKPFCFNRNILEAMRKTNQTFVYYFMYKNHLYSVTVPAGTDPSKVLEKNGCAGPLYIGKVLGTTVLIK